MYFTLYLYIAKRFLTYLMFAYVAVVSTFLLVDTLEFFRRGAFGKRVFLDVLFLTFSRIPFVLQETFFFVAFAAVMYTFIQLSKRNEYTAIKATGVSSLQFLMPFIVTILLLYVFMLTIINPLSSHLLAKRDKVRTHQKSVSALLENGFWLKNSEGPNGEKVIINSKSLRIHGAVVELQEVSFLYLDSSFRNTKTIQSAKARLVKGYWELEGVTEYAIRQKPISYDTLKIDTTITTEDLYNSFQKPEHVSIWKLPYFIYILKETGHSAKAYMLYFSKLVLKPLMLIPMIMIASFFILRPYRMLNLRIVIIGSIIVSVVFSVFTEAVYLVGAHMMLDIRYISNIFALLIFVCSLGLTRLIAKT